MTSNTPPTFTGGRNIAMKVPPHQWEETVRFYRDTLALRELDNPYDTGPQSVGFEFGANRLWIDRVPTISQAEMWLQVTTDDTAAAAELLAAHGVARCDDIEPLGTTSAYWISSPASIVHLISEPDTD
ncbi:hypothetical protein [Modestobacter sp. VKM Ac-2984]|uniref:hypothetical protein n=1 Tax=Modestobacter sp. VKM Ac-2984 TaxID=3004138 RepID=UPI0022AA782D|nr:hypothetical protein [Modestobacter sp. VKM Ac-2984]MCZ2815330.1 hypothetical protein [Modestobacter sp. VKM Ac-2984]